MDLKPVLVTTQHRGVFFGYMEEQARSTLPAELMLYRARNCIYWDSTVKGFMGLSANGPTARCRIGPEADITLYDITSVSAVSPLAVTAWDAAPWK